MLFELVFVVVRANSPIFLIISWGRELYLLQLRVHIYIFVYIIYSRIQIYFIYDFVFNYYISINPVLLQKVTTVNLDLSTNLTVILTIKIVCCECIWFLNRRLQLSCLWFHFSELCASVSLVIQGSGHIVNGKDIQEAGLKNGNTVWKWKAQCYHLKNGLY